MAEHTPGPWTIAERSKFDRDDEPSFEIVADDAAAFVAALVPNEADARLIAAAPDLLAALEALVEKGETPHPLSGRAPTVRAEDIPAALAAIEKAKGSETAAP